MELDLHGTKHEDVTKTLDSFLYTNMKKKGVDRVHIITGHSVEMKKIVSNVAKEYGFTAVENMFNGGELIIDF